MRNWRVALLLGLALASGRVDAAAPILLALSRPHAPDEGLIVVPTRGPDEVPERLFGWWRIGLCVKEGIDEGHAWIRYEDFYSGEVHTVGRFMVGIQGIRDQRTKDWIYPPIKESGLYWDYDLRLEHEVRQGKYLLKSVVLEHPSVFRGQDVRGHGLIRNNCVTFVRDAWEFYSGERIDLPPLHLPTSFQKRVAKSVERQEPASEPRWAADPRTPGQQPPGQQPWPNFAGQPTFPPPPNWPAQR